MDQADETLPIRLKPRRRHQIFFFFFFGFVFLFAIGWMIGTSQPGATLRVNGVEVTDPFWRSLYPLGSIPIALFAICGFAVAVLKMLPNSPYYYLELAPDGLTLATLFKKQSFAWRDLPALTSKEENDSESGSYHYVVATDDETSAKSHEMLRFPVSQYGTVSNKKGTLELAAWINQLRELALQGRLDVKTKIEIPGGFARHIVAAPMAARHGATAGRTVVRTR
jgi:hypothetical protein